jgi:beta-lactamase regulating signal transducer with metallopeptidase domain/protocatechuate 3,4-dioxygenase beta subunit
MSLVEIADRWVIPGLTLLAGWSVRWGVLLAVFLIWLAVLPPRRAATRYLMGMVLLASGLLLPVVPRWGRIAIPRSLTTANLGGSPSADAVPRPALPIAEPDRMPIEVPARKWIGANPTVTDERPRPAEAVPAPSPAATLGRWRWAALTIAAGWFLAVFVLACRLAGGMLWLVRLRKEADDVDEVSRLIFEDCRRTIGLCRRVSLAAHPAVGSPLTLGGRGPTILVPVEWASWSEGDRRTSLLHELAHLVRYDDRLKLAQELIRIPFFFHPLVHRLMARIDRERELLCDETVVALGSDPLAYARLLLDLARCPGRLLPFATTFRVGCLRFFDRGTVIVRIEHLLEDDMGRTLSRPSTLRLVATGIATLGVALGAGGVGVQTVGPKVKKPGQDAQPAALAKQASPRQIEGLIREPDGKPAAGAVVVAALRHAAEPNRQVLKTSSDGRFIWSIPDGVVSLYLVVHKQGFAPAIWMGGLEADKRGDKFEEQLRTPEPFSAVLVDTDGRPLAGARVRIEMFAHSATLPRDGTGSQTVSTTYTYVRREVIRDSPLEELFETTTDQNGAFTLPTPGPDTWLKLRVTPVGARSMRLRAEKEPQGAIATTMGESGFVAAPAGQSTRLIAVPAARIAGRVVTKLPGVNIMGLEVSFQDSHPPDAGKLASANFGVQDEVKTDKDGRFVIDALSEGTVNVFVHGTGEGESWTYRAAQDVMLKPGETSEIDFELVRGVEVKGQVVAQSSETPVAGAGVGVYGPFRPRTGAMTRSARTDAQGTYRHRLPPGETYLYVMAPPPGFRRLAGEGSSRTVNIPAGVDHFDVPPLAIAGAVTVRGRVVDTAGAPVAGATIVGTCEGNVCVQFPGKETVTDARGEFRLPEGGYNTIAKGEPARLLVRLRDGAEHEVAVIPGNDGVATVKLALRVEKTAGVDGPKNVGPDELAGVVVDAHGKPLEGVEVDAWTWYPGNETHTDARGWFRLAKLDKSHKDRKIEVRFTKPGYTPELFLKQPSGVANWVVVLDNKTYFEGTVTTPGGKPAPGVLIRANPGMKQADGFMLSEIWTETRTDERGRYRLYAPADVYDVQVRAPDVGVARLKETSLGTDEAKRLDISLSPGVKFRAKVVDSLTGKPVAGVRLWHWQHKGIEGRSESDGMVTIADMLPGPFSFSVEADGYARWWSDQSSSQWGRRQILPGRSGGPGWQRNFDSVDFELRPAMEPVTITLEPAVKITGEVRDPDGNPVAGATVAPALTGTGNSLTGDTRFSVTTDPQGHFEMPLPASGEREYNVVAHDGKYQQWRKWANGVHRPFRAKPGEKLAMVLMLTSPATVRGRVVDGTGKPVANREVRASAADKLENRYYDPTVKSAADGSFELKYIRPGEQFIQAAPFWLDAAQAPPGSSLVVTLKAGETKDDLILRVERE